MAFKNNSDMDSETGKKKKNFVAGWFGRLLPPRFLEFETPLTSRECYERLQKLLRKMVYLKAKNKVELANAAMPPFQLQWKPDENICEFVQASQNRQGIGLQGRVFFSDIYETTLVQCRLGSNRNASSCWVGILLFLIGMAIIPLMVIWTSGVPLNQFLSAVLPFWLGTFSCLRLLGLFLVFGVRIPQTRASIKLLRNVLTEPDETQF